MRTLLLCFMLMVTGILADAQPEGCPCDPGTKIDRQHRSGAKHEANYSQYGRKRDTIHVHYIYGWQDQYGSLTSQIKSNPGKEAAKRKHGTPEDSLYVVEGYMWFVKQEDNDCDLHIEIGTKDPTGVRIVVEVTQENSAVQNLIKQELDKRGLHIKGCKPGHSGDNHFPSGIPVIVTGLGFYDASHKPGTNHGDAHTARYSWELHPVKEVVFLK